MKRIFNRTQSSQKINFQDFTELPVTSHLRADTTGGVVEVITPHKGKVNLDMRYDGMLNVYDKLTTRLINEIKKLENESYEYLLDKWKKSL